MPAPRARPADDRRTYVLDTSVLLADPRALLRFDEHDVVLPVVVLTELEAKRDHPELGWAARRALRLLEDFRLEHGSLTEPLPVNDHGGTLRVELNHADTSCLPASLTADNNDHRILAVARNLAAEGRAVTVVTKDLPLRLKASIVGLDADEYRNELAVDPSWTGFVELDVEAEVVDAALRRPGRRPRRGPRPARATPASPSSPGSQSALGRVHDDKRIHLVRGDRSLFDVHGRSAEQRIAIDLLADPSVGHRVDRRARPAPASRCSPSPPASTPCSSSAPTSGSPCSARSTPSAARTSASCPAPRPRR